MMTPPNGSAEARGMTAVVANAPRHRKALTPIPELPPPPPLPWSLDPLPMPKMVPLSLPPSRVTDTSPADPLPRPWKSGGVGFGFTLSDEHAATPSTAITATGRSRAENGVGRIAVARFVLLRRSRAEVFSLGRGCQQSRFYLTTFSSCP